MMDRDILAVGALAVVGYLVVSDLGATETATTGGDGSVLQALALSQLLGSGPENATDYGDGANAGASNQFYDPADENYLGQDWSDVTDRVEENEQAENENPMAGVRL
jgi:hypothetical protein